MSYSPASILTSGSLPNLVAIHYERKSIPNLKANTPFMSMTKQKPLPVKSGNQVQFFTYALLGSNTTQAAEGTVGSGVTETSTSINATIGQYADFINSSDLAMDVAIDDGGLMQSLSEELAYRLALTLNKLVQLTADAGVSVDSSVNIDIANGTFLTANGIRSAVQSLANVNARPMLSDGGYGGIIHPFAVRDVLNDTSLNGLTDILKRGSDSDRAKLLGPLGENDVIEFAGVKFKQTTTAPSGTVDAVLKYNTYVFGDDAIFSIFLGKNAAGDKNYKLMVQEAPQSGSVSDPARQIGGWVSYNVKYTNTLRPGATMTYRRIQAQTGS
jgi:N4-gp56 family major capsid protein